MSVDEVMCDFDELVLENVELEIEVVGRMAVGSEKLSVDEEERSSVASEIVEEVASAMRLIWVSVFVCVLLRLCACRKRRQIAGRAILLWVWVLHISPQICGRP